MAFHQLVVDTYAVQHPDGEDPRAIQSVGIHLMTLCLFLERGTDPSLGTRLHRRMVDRPVFHQLKPPAIARAAHAPGRAAQRRPGDRTTRRIRLAEDVWTAWVAHHQTVRDWVDRSGLGTQA